jgi:hypothetical protein
MTKRTLPPTYFLANLVLIAALAFALPIAPLLSGPWRATGFVPIAAGMWLNLAAVRAFKARGTTMKAFERSSALVTDGPFWLEPCPPKVVEPPSSFGDSDRARVAGVVGGKKVRGQALGEGEGLNVVVGV